MGDAACRSNEPLISVVVPVYKVEPYLRKCVDSILGQTYRNLEIILVDDGSPDGCPAICDEYAEKDRRVKVIHQKNGGLSDARNAGLDIAAGEWLSFIDSDDWIEPDMYEYILMRAEESGADISVGGVNDELLTNGSTKIIKSTFSGITEENVLSNTEAMAKYFQTSWSAWNKIYRRELFDGIRFPAGEINEDEAIVLRLLERCKHVTYTNKVYYHYIHRPESITTSAFSEKKLAWYRHCADNLEWIKSHHPELEQLAAKRLCDSVLWSLREIALSDSNFVAQRIELLNDIKTHYTYYRSLELNRAERMRLLAVRRFPFGIYRFIERARQKKHLRRNMI